MYVNVIITTNNCVLAFIVIDLSFYFYVVHFLSEMWSLGLLVHGDVLG